MSVVTSLQNPIVKRIRAVGSRKGREREGCFWAEGIHITMEALETGWPMERLVWCPDLLTSEVARESIQRANADAMMVSRSVFRKISGRENPAGIGALLATKHRSLGALDVESGAFFVVLDRVGDPGNLGTVIRTVASAGGDAVILVGASTDPFDPRSVRAAMGSLFTLPVVAEGRADGFLDWARKNGLNLVGSSSKGNVHYREAEYRRPVALMLGSEQHGLDDTLARVVGTSVHIPMAGRASSLNLSAAAAVLAFTASEAGTR